MVSLIEEALRKQREETERAHPHARLAHAPASDTPPPLPSNPPPNAPPGPPPESQTQPPPGPDVPPEKSRRTWRLLVGMAVILLIAVAVLIWMMVFGFTLFRKTPPNAPAPTALQPPSPTATQTVAVIPPEGTAGTSTATLVTDSIPAVDPAAATTTVSAVVEPLPATPADATTPTGTHAATPPEKPQPLLVWPRIMVSGIMGGGRAGRSTALVNGQMVSVGESVESAKVVAIDKHGVTFNFAGETRTLSVGASTE